MKSFKVKGMVTSFPTFNMIKEDNIIVYVKVDSFILLEDDTMMFFGRSEYVKDTLLKEFSIPIHIQGNNIEIDFSSGGIFHRTPLAYKESYLKEGWIECGKIHTTISSSLEEVYQNLPLEKIWNDFTLFLGNITPKSDATEIITKEFIKKVKTSNQENVKQMLTMVQTQYDMLIQLFEEEDIVSNLNEDEKYYISTIESFIEILNACSLNDESEESLNKKLREYIANGEFEKAAVIRDKILSLKKQLD